MNGMAEAAKKVAECSKAVKDCERELNTQKKYLDTALRNGLSGSPQRLDVNWAGDRLKNAQRELEKAQQSYKKFT